MGAAMSDLEDGRKACEALLTASTGAAVPASSIAWKGTGDPASKTAGARWYRATFIRGTPRAIACGPDAENRHVCIFQVDIFDPPNLGEEITATEAKRVMAFYKRGTVLTRNGLSIVCQKAYLGTADDSDPAWFKIPVVVEVRADVAN
jgi:hypothetical protein